MARENPRFHNKDGVRIQYTEAEELARDAEEAVELERIAVERAAHEAHVAKMQRYEAKGWVTDGQLDMEKMLEDMADRPMATVLAEFKAARRGA